MFAEAYTFASVALSLLSLKAKGMPKVTHTKIDRKYWKYVCFITDDFSNECLYLVRYYTGVLFCVYN